MESRVSWPLIALGLITIGLAFVPFVMLRIRLNGMEGFQGTFLTCLCGGDSTRVTMMFWDVYRCMPFLQALPSFLPYFGVKTIHPVLLQFASLPLWVLRTALIYPLVAGTAMIATALHPNPIAREIARVVIGAIATLLACAIVAPLAGWYVAPALLIGLLIAVVMRGVLIVRRRASGAIGRWTCALAGASLAVSMTAALVVMRVYWRQTYPDRYGPFDRPLAQIGVCLLFAGGIMAVATVMSRRDAIRSLLASASFSACLLGLILIPSYAVVRSAAILRDVAAPTIPAAVAHHADSTTKMFGKDFREYATSQFRSAEPEKRPEVEGRSLAVSCVLLGTKAVAFAYIFLWLLGGGVTGLLHILTSTEPSTLFGDGRS